MKKISFFLAIYFLTIFSSFYIVDYGYEKQLENIKKVQLEKYQLIYKIMSDRIQKEADNIFNILIQNHEKVKELFENRNQEELYNYLETNFQTLKQNAGYEILHFHLPDNVTFLRMHKKDKYGDDLSKVRYSVSYVNKFKKKISGIEVGRSITSYRFVYPIFYKEKYIGSVEISRSLDNLSKEMEDLYSLHGNFLIRSDIFENKDLFQNSLDNYYEKSIENDDYFKIKSSHNTHNIELEDIASVKEDISQKMKSNETFVIDLNTNTHFVLSHDHHAHYSLVFIPLVNVQNQSIGYNVFHMNDDKTIQTRNNQYITSFVIFLVISFIFYYMYNKINQARQLEEKVKEKTTLLDESLQKAQKVNLELEEKSNQLQYTVRQVEEINDDLEESNILLEQQKALYNIVFEDSFDGISIINIHENTFVECNNRFLEMLGADNKDEVLNLQPSELSSEFQPDGKSSFDKASEMIKIAISRGNNLFEWMHKKCTGEEFWVEVSLTHFVLNGQEMLYVIWKDIDEKKKIEEKNLALQKETKKINTLLKVKTTELENHKSLLEEKVIEQTKELLEQNEQLSIHKSELEAQNEELSLIQIKLKETSVELENLFNGIPYPVVLISENFEIKTQNLKFSMVFLEGKQYQTNLNLLTLVSKDNIDKILELFKSQEEDIIKMKTSESAERRFKLKKDKHPVDEKLVILSLIDIEDELLLQEKMKEQETQFLQQSKMAALGDMIGNIAHQWRQPLNAISVAASGLEVQHELGLLDEKNIKQLIPTILDNTNYLSKTIETFRNFITKDKEEKVVIIQDEIDVALNFVKDNLHNNFISLINNIDYENPIKSFMIENELTEVVINICNNAKDILVEKKIKDAWIKIDLIYQSNKVIITIEDNAGGVPSQIIDKIFEPYFTTKHQSKGTGLGLHMSYRLVVESMKGNLYVQNTTNGAKFFIELPINSCEL